MRVEHATALQWGFEEFVQGYYRCYYLTEGMLETDPEKRMSMEEVTKLLDKIIAGQAATRGKKDEDEYDELEQRFAASSSSNLKRLIKRSAKNKRYADLKAGEVLFEEGGKIFRTHFLRKNRAA